MVIDYKHWVFLGSILLIFFSMGFLIVLSIDEINKNRMVINTLVDNLEFVSGEGGSIEDMKEDVFYLRNNVQVLNQQFIALVNNLDRMKMYGHRVRPTGLLNGVYHYEGYYCVWTENRSSSAINNTDYHEACHAFIDMDSENHFCKVDEV